MNVVQKSTWQTNARYALTGSPLVDLRDLMTQWAKGVRRVQEKTKAKAKERMAANKAEKDSEYGAKMAIMADLGGPTKLSGKVHKEVSRIPHSTNTDIPGTPRARGVQAGWARQDMRLQARTGWERPDMQLLEINRDSCYPCAARSLVTEKSQPVTWKSAMRRLGLKS